MKDTTISSSGSLSDAAIALARKFTDFQGFAAELERKSIESDKGLERACQLLVELDLCGQGIQQALVGFTQLLETERRQTESAAQKVARKASEVNARRAVVEEMAKRLREFGEEVGQVTEEVAAIKPKNAMSEDEKSELKKRAESVGQRLLTMVEFATKYKEDAHAQHLAAFERTADRLRQSLQSAGNRLALFAKAG